MEMQPVPNEPALFIRDREILVIADLHIGIESGLKEHGLNAASQIQQMINHFISICKKCRPKEIILLGDVKHNIPSSTIQERKDVINFLESINSFGVIHLIPGNHDGFIKKISPEKIIIHPSDGIVLENIGFIHGHRWPKEEIMQCEQIIIGHTHPTIKFTDRIGYSTFEPCWLKARAIEDKVKERYPNSADAQILVMPAFNPLCGGIAVNKEGVVGPFGKMIDIQNAQVYLLDGSALGSVKDIK